MGKKEDENIHSGHRKRQRDRIKHSGCECLQDYESVEFLLSYALPRIDTNPLAHRLIQHFGDIAGIFEADFNELQKVQGIGENAALLLSSIPDILRRYQLALLKRANIEVPLTYGECIKLVAPYFVGKKTEHFYMMCFDNRGKVLDIFLIREGAVNQVTVDTRRLVSRACELNAASIMLFHNHPSGTADPSVNDEESTNHIKMTLDSIGITLIDHIVAADTEYQSILRPRCSTRNNTFHNHFFSPCPLLPDAPQAQSSGQQTDEKEQYTMNYPVFDAHMHPYIDPDENICNYPLPVAPEEIGADLARIGITRFAGSVITRNFQDFDTVRRLNRHALKLRDIYGDAYIPGVHIHPDYVQESCEELKAMYDQGIRLIGELVPYMMGWKAHNDWQVYTCPGAMEIFSYAQELGMTVSIHPTNDEDMLNLYQSFPRMTFIAAHPGEKNAYMKHLERMELCPNAYLDICGTGFFRYGMLSYGVNRMGSERFLFGTDFPTCTPGMQISGVLYERMSEADYENILYKNAERLLLRK